MTRDGWETIALVEKRNLVIGYPWYFVWDLVGDWTRLRLKAEGSWSCLGEAVKPCGPDGHVSLAMQADRLLVAGAAPGVLIAKLGGSVASRTDAVAFTVGSLCILPMPKKENSHLYIGVNGATPSASTVLDEIRLGICGIVDQG